MEACFGCGCGCGGGGGGDEGGGGDGAAGAAAAGCGSGSAPIIWRSGTKICNGGGSTRGGRSNCGRATIVPTTTNKRSTCKPKDLINTNGLMSGSNDLPVS